MNLAVRAERTPLLTRQFIGQPETGIVAGLGVLRAGIAQPYDQPQGGYWSRHHHDFAQ